VFFAVQAIDKIRKNDTIKYTIRKHICPKARTAVFIRRGDGRRNNNIFEPKKTGGWEKWRIFQKVNY
jgi:hypothetical protein